METFFALLAICAENSPVPGEFTAQRPVTRSFDVFFDLRLNKRLSKQLWGRWFETLSHPLWRHRNEPMGYGHPEYTMYLTWIPIIEWSCSGRAATIMWSTVASYFTWSWWRHQMETFSALLAVCEWDPPITVGFPSQKPVTCQNNRDACDLRRHQAHYNVTVMTGNWLPSTEE